MRKKQREENVKAAVSSPATPSPTSPQATVVSNTSAFRPHSEYVVTQHGDADSHLKSEPAPESYTQSRKCTPNATDARFADASSIPLHQAPVESTSSHEPVRIMTEEPPAKSLIHHSGTHDSTPSFTHQAKVELVEPYLHNEFVHTVNDYRPGLPLQPEPPPRLEQSKSLTNRWQRGASSSSPSPPSKIISRKSFSSRDAIHEDGEIFSPPHKPPMAPRAHTPPTHPRSFHTNEGMPPSNAMSPPVSVRRTLQLAPYRAHAQNLAPPPRPLPIAPRALRTVNRYGTHPVPRGPSADRDRGDWDRDRSWMSSSRGRGRGANGNWGR